MFCKSCGKPIDNDSRFCSYCGTKQSTGAKQTIYKEPANLTNLVRQPKYDPIYTKEDSAVAVGIILLIISLTFAIVGPIKFEDRESFALFRVITAIISTILRIFIIVWIVNIARRQNRNTFGWGLFGFLLPSIALIIIGTKRKLFNSEEQREILIQNNKLREKHKIIEDENGVIINPPYSITPNGETYDFKNGKSKIFNIEFENLFRDMIYERTKDGKYYYQADYKGEVYCSTKEVCIKAILFDRLNK